MGMPYKTDSKEGQAAGDFNCVPGFADFNFEIPDSAVRVSSEFSRD